MDDVSVSKTNAGSPDQIDALGSVLAIDPGRDKCGLAVLDYKSDILYKNITQTTEIMSYLQEIFNNYRIKEIIIGNGTYSERISDIINRLRSEIPVHVVDEAYTTVEAEDRYIKEHKKSWQRWLPFIRWKPSEPVDDYVAVILAERFLKDRFTSG